jgi:hypothetical protein
VSAVFYESEGKQGGEKKEKKSWGIFWACNINDQSGGTKSACSGESMSLIFCRMKKKQKKS